MPTEIHFMPDGHRNCWLGYFDLLGTRERIRSGNYLQVFDVYAKALELTADWKENSPEIQHACFSDTFIIYSLDDSARSFALLEQVVRWFAYSLIIAKIPVRGALSCGDFYSDRKNSLYFGPALIEAYEYGEAQDWIGFLLTPSAVAQMEKVDLSAKERLNYTYGEIPLKKDATKTGLTGYLPACILGRWITLNGVNPCVAPLIKMSQQVSVEFRQKYLNTLKFIANNLRGSADKKSEPQ